MSVPAKLAAYAGGLAVAFAAAFAAGAAVSPVTSADDGAAHVTAPAPDSMGQGADTSPAPRRESPQEKR